LRFQVEKASKNFLGDAAARARAARSERKAAMVGFDRSKTKAKLSNTGSGVPFEDVVRFKYQKGFTQAVRTPCRMEDLT
jgi:chromosome transmission fidelity protein 18